MCLLLSSQAPALASDVLVLGPDGQAVQREDPFLGLTPPAVPASAAHSPHARAARGGPSVSGVLHRLRRTHAISAAAYRRYGGDYASASAALRRLRGTRSTELGAVLATLRAIAAGNALSPSRLPALFTTLERNEQWWTRGPLLSAGQRVEFKGSELVWEYYQGQGIQLQELGSFGKADGLYTAGKADYGRMKSLLDEIVPLGAKRAGKLTWEYYFSFGGGRPPWASAMAQGTAVEAFTRAYQAFRDRRWLAVAHRALPELDTRPPRGVSVKTSRGLRFLLYSFDSSSKDAVLNGFLQTLIGLYDYAHVSRDRRAASLFARGDAEARFEVPHYDTGKWSLYQPGVLDSPDYHNLVTGFLQELCDRAHAKVYCTTAARFRGYAKHPPPGV